MFRSHHRRRLFQKPVGAPGHRMLSDQLLRSPGSSHRVCTVPPQSEAIPQALSGRATGLLPQPIFRLEKQAFALLLVAPEGSEFVKALGPNIIILGDSTWPVCAFIIVMTPLRNILALLIGLVWISNAFLMLLSPRSWFRLSRWTGVQGSHGRNAMAIRMLGAIFLGVFAWISYDMLFSH